MNPNNQPPVGAVSQQSATNPEMNSQSKGSPVVQRILILLVVVMALPLAFFGYKYFELSQGQVAGAQTADEAQEVIDSVRDLLEIPETENINVARADDTESLREQNPTFYRDLVQGQYVVVLTNSQKVLIYDKGLDKIINFSTYTIDPQLIPEEDIEASEKPLRIEIRYVEGIETEAANNIQTRLEELSENYSIVGKTRSQISDHEGIIMVALNREAKPNMTLNLQNQLLANVINKQILEEMPEGEPDSTADVVVILGNN